MNIMCQVVYESDGAGNWPVDYHQCSDDLKALIDNARKDKYKSGNLPYDLVDEIYAQSPNGTVSKYPCMIEDCITLYMEH